MQDEQLQEAYAAIEQKLEIEAQKVMDRKWKDVSNHLSELLAKKKYTAKACMVRFEGLHDGSALLAIELDPDQEGRKQMRGERIAANKQLRAAEAAMKAEVVDEKALRKEAMRQAKEERGRQRILATHKREAAKLELERAKKLKLDERAKQVADRKKAVAFARVQVRWLDDKLRAEKHLLAKFLGKPSRNRAGRARTPKDDFVVDDDEDDFLSDLSDEDEAMETDDNDNEDEEPDGRASSRAPDSRSLPRRKAVPSHGRIRVTKETLLNPRSVMTDAELKFLLQSRGLRQPTSRESHAQTVARLAAADDDMSTTELSDLLRACFENVKGSKEAKIQRLRAYDAKRSAAGSDGVKATDPEFKKGYEGYEGAYKGLLDED